jgi:hypothetical protein
VRHEPQRIDAGRAPRPIDQQIGIRRVETESIHAGIEFQPGVYGAVPTGIEQVELFGAVHDRLESMLYRHSQLGRIHDPGQQYDLGRHPVLAQFDGLGHARYRKRVDVRQVLGNRDHAVSVGIRLDNGHHFRARCGLAYDVEIVFQRAEPNQGPCSETH